MKYSFERPTNTTHTYANFFLSTLPQEVLVPIGMYVQYRFLYLHRKILMDYDFIPLFNCWDKYKNVFKRIHHNCRNSPDIENETHQKLLRFSK